MIEYIRSIPTEEFLTWLQTDIMPWITAIITGVVMVTPMVATLISKLKAFVATIESSFDTVRNAERRARDCKKRYGRFWRDTGCDNLAPDRRDEASASQLVRRDFDV